MTRCRVYYQQSGKISVDHADQRPGKKPKDMTNDDWIDAQFLQSGKNKPNLHVDGDLSKPLLDYEEIDDSALPNGSAPTDRKDRDRWRGNKLTGIKIDTNIVLRKDLFKQIDNELAKPSPDIFVIERIRSKIELNQHD